MNFKLILLIFISVPFILFGVVETEPNNTAAETGVLTVEAGIHAGSIDPGSDLDFWSFEASMDDVVEVTTVGYTSLDTQLWIYAEDGATQLAYNDDWGSLQSYVTITITEEGTYYFVVGSYGAGTGAYEVELIGATPPVHYDDDLQGRIITGNPMPTVGGNTAYLVYILNYGNDTVMGTDYDVELYLQGDIFLGSIGGIDLGPGAQDCVELSCSFDTPGETYVYGSVVFEDDEDISNNQTDNFDLFIQPEGITAIMVGDGTDLSYQIPANLFWRNSISESWFYPDEIGVSGAINQISYYPSLVNDMEDISFDIWIGCSGQENAAAWIPANELTQVVQETLDFSSDIYRVDFILDVPIIFDGTENLVIMMQKLDNSSYSTSDNWYVTDNSGHPSRTIHHYSDFDDPDENNPPYGYVTDLHPNITLYIEAVNSPPHFDPVGDQMFDEDTGPFVITITGINDGDLALEQELELNVVYGETPIIDVFSFDYTPDETSATINFDIITNMYDEFDVTVTLTDDAQEYNTYEETFTISITPVNDPPILTITGESTLEEDLASIGYDFSPFASQTWGEEDVLTLSADDSDNINVNIAGFEVTFVAGTDNWYGTDYITFYLDDNVSREIASQTIPVTVTPVNDPPILNITGTMETDEDMPSQTYDFSGYCSQVWGEEDDLTLTADNSEHIDITVTDFDVVFESNTENWNGSEEITFYLNDNVSTARTGRDIVEQAIWVTINPVNDAPDITLPDEFTFAEDETLVEDFTSYLFDIDEDDLVLTVSGNIEIDASINGLEVTFSATANWFGSEILTFTVNDNQGRATADDDIEVTVTGVDDAPEIIYHSPVDTLIVIDDTEYITQTFIISAFDIESDPILYTWFVNDVDQEVSDSTLTLDFLTGEYIVTAYATALDLFDNINWYITSNVSNDNNDVPNITKLNQNIPNPFNPETIISYQLAQESHVEIDIYNIRGQCIKTLVDENKQAGSYEISWNGRASNDREVCSGIYFYLMKTKDYVEIKKMILLK